MIDVDLPEDDGLSDLDRIFEAALNEHSASAEPESAPEVEEAPKDAGNRDEKGRFASSEKQEPQEDAAPEDWDEPGKQAWQTLTPEARAYIRQREQALKGSRAEVEQRVKQFEPLESVLGPRRQVLAATYGSEEAALKQLFALSDFAERDPAGFVQWFAQQRGIALQNGQQSKAESADPTIAALTRELNALKGQITQSQQQEQERQRASLRSEIDTFAKDKPDFDKLKPVMAGLFATGQAKDLSEAYDKARWADPELRERLVEERAAQARAEAQGQREKAKGAAVSVSGAPSGKPATAKIKSVDDALNAALQSLS